MCVEADRFAADIVARNAVACGFGDRVEVVRGRIPEALGRIARGRFALAFVDPPYQEGPEAALALVAAALAPAARVVAEHDVRRPPPDRIGALALADRRSYGGTGISIYVRD